MKLKLLNEYQTKQCVLKLYTTELSVDDEEIYCLKSYHLNTQKVLIRFGNKCQVKGMIKTYNLERRFEL